MAARFPDVPILLYHELLEHEAPDARHHEVSLAQFRAQLDVLMQLGFEIMSLAGLIGVINAGTAGSRRIAVITFDDGYRSFAQLALPELMARRLTATVFVPGGEIGGTNAWDRAAGYPQRPIMGEAQLREAAGCGIELGVHGWRHRNLTRCTADEAREEIERPRIEFERRFGRPPVTFSYPYGAYAAEHVHMVRAAGYGGAVSIFTDEPTVAANPYAMRRIYIHPGDTAWRFRCKLTGLYLRYKALRGAPSR